MAGFSVFALVAFTVAFALAAQGRCGPGCDALGTAFSPGPDGRARQLERPDDHRPQAPHHHNRGQGPGRDQRPPGRLRRAAGHDHHRTASHDHDSQAHGRQPWDHDAYPTADDAAAHDASTHDRTDHGPADDDRTARHLASTPHPRHRASSDTRSVATIAASPSRSEVCGR